MVRMRARLKPEAESVFWEGSLASLRSTPRRQSGADKLYVMRRGLHVTHLALGPRSTTTELRGTNNAPSLPWLSLPLYPSVFLHPPPPHPHRQRPPTLLDIYVCVCVGGGGGAGGGVLVGI